MVLDRTRPEASIFFYVFCLLIVAGKKLRVGLARVLPNLRLP